MNLIGSRTTLIANVCALVVASVLVAEGAYIVLVDHARPSAGNYLTHDAWGFYIPALVMFIIRNRMFSWFFLVIYIALSIQMFFQARSLYLGTYGHPFEKWGPLGYPPLFVFLSLFFLACYVVVALVQFVARRMG